MDVGEHEVGARDDALRRDVENVLQPVLVLGAARDTFLTRAEVDATARAYRTEATLFPMAHDMMLEDGWKDVADHIVRWLDGLDLTTSRRTPP